jgi:quinoprotein glucose dehydrogenase
MPSNWPGFVRRRQFAHRLALAAVLILTAWIAADRALVTATLTLVSAPTGVVRLDPREADRLAQEARAKVTVTMAPGLELSLWAPGVLIKDPLAIDIDNRGVLYVTSTPRTALPLDIRDHPDWVPEVHTLTTVDQHRDFMKRVMAPERSAQNGWLPDLNRDGSRDWRDLAGKQERVYRLEDTAGRGRADLSEIVVEGFVNDDPVSEIAGGVMYKDGDLFIGAAPDLWRFRDTNGDGRMDVRDSISHGYNIHPAFGGHGMSGITMGPDGRLYWKVGDIGLNVVDKSGTRWAYPNRGSILRANPDGTEFEVFASGLRNTHEFAFDEHGNLISVDNDGDHPGETERVVYITYGSDTGWRSTWQYGKYTDSANNRYNVWMAEGMFRPRFDGQAAYFTPAIAPYPSGPSGLVYHPGVALDDRWRQHFLVTSFTGSPASARLFALKLNERGAGFELASNTEILRGILTPGIKIGPDGALYMSDWITGWDPKDDGRIWKLDVPAAATSAARIGVRKLLVADITAQSSAALRAMLSHADMRVRQRAQFELVRRKDDATLLEAARAELRNSSVTNSNGGAFRPDLARLHAIWGLGQLARTSSTYAGLLLPFLGDIDPEVRAQTAKMLGEARYSAPSMPLSALLRDPAPRVRFFTAEALGRIARPGFSPDVAPLITMLAENDDRDVYLRHAGSLALSRYGTTALAGLDRHSSRAVRLAAVIALRRLGSEMVAAYLNDSDELVVAEAARAINDEAGIPGALPALALLLDQSRLTSEPALRRAISASLRVGTSENATRLGAFAARAGVAEALRVEAIAALGVWAAPSALDRVDGAHLGALSSQREPQAARAPLARFVAGLGAEQSSSVRIAVMDAAGRSGLTSASPALFDRLKNDAVPQVRSAALRAMQALKSAELPAAVKAALADADPTVRSGAITAMPSMPIPESTKVESLASILRSGSLLEQQTALSMLGRLKGPEARQALGQVLDRLVARELPAELQLDVVEAAAAQGGLEGRLAALGLGPGLETLPSVLPESLQRGGIAARGRQIFQQHEAAQCTRCHSIGTAPDPMPGPHLLKIGGALTRDQLLESLVYPSARIAPGFGVVSVTLRDGTTVVGMLREETDSSVLLETGTDATRRIAKTDIKTRTAGPSPMPPMAVLLKWRDIRDLVEFLSTLR